MSPAGAGRRATGGAGEGGATGRQETAAELFQRLCKEHPVPKRRLFSLLARVRAAVAWRDGLEGRRGAVRRRIMALTALVYCHPSQGEDATPPVATSSSYSSVRSRPHDPINATNLSRFYCLARYPVSISRD